MISTTDFKPVIAWRSYMKNVIKSADAGTDPAEYDVTIEPVDINEPGASDASKDIGYFIADYIGNVYKIKAIDVGGDSTRITVIDSFWEGLGPTANFQGMVFKSAFGGLAPYIAPIYSRHMARTAMDKIRSREVSIMYRTRERIDFADTNTPGILNYQTDWAEYYGEYPDVTLITIENGTEHWQRYEVPVRNFVDGKLDNIIFDLPFPISGYILLSR